MNARGNRALHLIDIENLAGSPLPTSDDVVACREWYEAAFVTDCDLVVVACSHLAFRTVGWAWPGVRHLLRSGKNGADLTLLDVVATERVSERFDTVMIGSGDGIFADTAAHLGGVGVTVIAVSRPVALARRLRIACRHVELLSVPITAAVRPLESA